MNTYIIVLLRTEGMSNYMRYVAEKKKLILTENNSAEFRFIKENALFKDLDDNDYALIQEKVSPFVNIYKKNETVANQGHECNHLGILVSGQAYSEKYHIDGFRQIIGHYRKNSLLCMESAFSRNGTSPVTIIAKTECRIVWFSLLKLLDSQLLMPEIKVKLYKNIMYEMADENIRLMYKSDVLAHHTLRDRVMAYLSIISEKRRSNEIHIHMTQVDFADYLCVDRSALSAELNAMRREGLISYKKDFFIIHVKPD